MATSNRDRRARRRQIQQAKVGQSPGTLIRPVDYVSTEASLWLFRYTPAGFEERKFRHVDECLAFLDQHPGPGITWINVEGVGDLETIEKLGKRFAVHALTLEDIVNTEHRPKIEEMPEYLFLVVKMLSHDEPERRLAIEQVSFVLGSSYLLSFQERQRPGDVFDFVRARIRKENARIRTLGTDYLCYALMDAVVDYYFVALEECGEHIDALEEELINSPTIETLRKLYELKRRLLNVRRAIWPLREVLSSIERHEHKLFTDQIRLYMRDLYDHAIQVIDTVETDRETLGGMLDIYLSSVSNKMNAVMKVLTIIATIFMPLTFIAGVYGMNFDMPEIHSRYGYPAVLAVMAIITAGMVKFFRKKKWL